MTNFLNTVKIFFITIVATLIFVFSLSLCVELELLFRCERDINQQEFKMVNLDKFCTIDSLEKRLLKEPKNYIISIKLAQIYESLEEYKKANEFYKNALKISGRTNMSIYYFAMFCARQDLSAMASSLCEELSGNSKKVIEYKARIYDAIGDSLTKQKEYPAANKAYQVAYKYAKNISDKEFFSDLCDKYSISFAKLADYNIERNEQSLAVSNLENAIKIKETPESVYRLALVYLNNDNIKSERLMHRVLHDNFYIVNPYIYNKLLDNLIKVSKEEKNTGRANFYTIKLNRFKNNLKLHYVYKDDILITASKIYSLNKFISKEKKYYLVFNIKNNTKQKINKMYLKSELFVDSKNYVFEKKIFTKASPIGAFDTVSNFKILLPQEVEFGDKNDVVLKYYVKKDTKAPWTLVKIDSINF